MVILTLSKTKGKDPFFNFFSIASSRFMEEILELFATKFADQALAFRNFPKL